MRAVAVLGFAVSSALLLIGAQLIQEAPDGMTATHGLAVCFLGLAVLLGATWIWSKVLWEK